METLRFLMISSHYPPNHLGGDAVMAKYLADELARRGHEVHVLYDPEVYSLVRNARMTDPAPHGKGDPIIHTPTSRSGRIEILLRLSLGWSGKMREEVNGLTKSLKIDVVHWHNTKGFIGRPFVPQERTTFYTAHDYYLVCPRSNLARPDKSFCQKPLLCQTCLLRWRKPPQLWRVGSRRVIRLPSSIKVICPSDFMSRRLRLDGIVVHHLQRNFVPDPAPPASEEPPTGDSITFIGMLEPHKGPRTLLEAFAISRDRQGFRLNIVGEGSLKGELSGRVKTLGLVDRVSTPGFLPSPEVETIRRNSTAVVVPSEWPENAPLAALESLALGVPVLASDAGGLPEIAGSESGSMIFKAGDVENLADCLVTLWQNRPRLGDMKRKAREAYVARFSPDVHIAQYLRMVNEGH